MQITLEQAITLLKEGNVVAIPTDTVYGLAADMHCRRAIDKVFLIKKRPNDKPLIVLAAHLNQIFPFITQPPPLFDQLAQRFWPGALTLVVSIQPEMILDNIRAGLPKVGFRIPQHPLTLRLLEKVGPLVAPSANLSNHPSATSAEHVENDFGADFPVLDGGACLKGIESTILCYEDDLWQISRQGAVSAHHLSEVLGYVPHTLQTLPPALATRYMPKAKLHLSIEPYDGSISVVLGFAERNYPGAQRVILLGSLNEPEAVAGRLYAALREIDQNRISEVWVDMNFPREGLLGTVAARLLKWSI